MRIKLLIFLLGISLFSGCKTFTDYYYGVEYVYKNDTGHLIEIRSFGNIESTNEKMTSHIINIGDSISLNFTGEVSEEYRDMQTEVNYLVDNLKAYRFFGDSLEVFFDQKKVLKIGSEDESFIYNQSRYTSKRLGDREFEHLYVFTKDDYNNAVPIE